MPVLDELKFGVCNWNEIHHYDTFFAFPTNFIFTSSWNCVQEKCTIGNCVGAGCQTRDAYITKSKIKCQRSGLAFLTRCSEQDDDFLSGSH